MILDDLLSLIIYWCNFVPGCCVFFVYHAGIVSSWAHPGIYFAFASDPRVLQGDLAAHTHLLCSVRRTFHTRLPEHAACLLVLALPMTAKHTGSCGSYEQHTQYKTSHGFVCMNEQTVSLKYFTLRFNSYIYIMAVFDLIQMHVIKSQKFPVFPSRFH